ncbi:type IV pilus biogenesis protein PilM [Laceyella sacchari]|jgi:type IV pilus assembly protein PilM|uniref:Pilus assembly protein PilM n=1 Tax=Laceyella sacchari TaxID=37482 RepID=A0ABY5U1F4_LACSH|nr:pilus assembly protein PilM [Laceyella sacchari]TCW39185.1 Tfp pilus assembly PilM family ATPase [Laceyella sacchari]UWE03493.1 pilus assembly protein PilM [Laceyella sacchari]
MSYQIGIELSASFFKLVEVKKRRKSMELQQMVVHPLPSIWAREPYFLEREELIQTIQEALLGRRLHTERVRIGINCREVIFKRLMVPEMRKRQYRTYIKEQLIPLLELPFPDPVFDYQLIDHVWADGDRQEIMLALMSRSYRDALVRCFRFCGLDPVQIDIAPFCLYRWTNAYRGLTAPQSLILQISKLGVEASFFSDNQLIDTQVFSLPVADYMEGEDRPHPNPLHPLLESEEEINAYGEALLAKLYGLMDEKKQRMFACPQAEWVLAGEGLDMFLLEQWLEQNQLAKVTQAPAAELVMSEALKEKALRFVGSSLAVPLGLMVGEKEGMGR